MTRGAKIGFTRLIIDNKRIENPVYDKTSSK
jgi:hypothetical protein